MINIIIAGLIIIVAFSLLAERNEIAVARFNRIAPSVGTIVVSPDSATLAVRMPRDVIVFTLPDSFLAPSNLIMEAPLTIHITPNVGWDSTMQLEAYCVPITSPISGIPTWASLSSAYILDFSEFSIYHPETGTLFFEIAPMLYAATEAEVNFYGVMIIPSKISYGFSISPIPNPIEFGAQYYPGKKDTRY